MYMDNDKLPRYVGPPSDDIDDAWDKLLKGTLRSYSSHISTLCEDKATSNGPQTKAVTGTTVNLKGQEAESIKRFTVKSPQGYHTTSLDVFHTLHCVVCTTLSFQGHFSPWH